MEIGEGDSLEVTVTINPPAAAVITVELESSPPLTLSADTLVFNPGATTAVTTITVPDDNTDDRDGRMHTVALQLSSPLRATLGDDLTVIVPRDDADIIRTITIAPTVLSLTEGDTATSSLKTCLLYTSPSPRDRQKSRMPSSA